MNLREHPEWLELHHLIDRLKLMPQVSAVSLDNSGGKSSDEDIGGKRPSGGIDYEGDRSLDFRQKSHVYFQRRRRNVRTFRELEVLLLEAREAYKDWVKTPHVDMGKDPERQSFEWKCAIADDDRPVDKIKDSYYVSAATVYRYRAKYRHVLRIPSQKAV